MGANLGMAILGGAATKQSTREGEDISNVETSYPNDQPKEKPKQNANMMQSALADIAKLKR